MNKVQKISLLFVLLLVTTFANAQNAQIFEDSYEREGGSYKIYYQYADNDNNTLEVCAVQEEGVSYAGEIIIPSQATIIDNEEKKLFVVSIAKEAFKDATSLTSISIPASVKHIGKDAFSGCSLAKAIFSSVNDLCGITFENNNANPLYKSKHLYISDSEITILEIPDGVKEIKSYAFAGGRSIKKIKLSNSVRQIGTNAFQDCSGGYQLVYYDFDQIMSIEYGDDAANPMGQASGFEISSGSLNDGVIQIDRDVNYNAFRGAKWLKQVIFKDGVTTIGKSAFYGCTELSSVSFSQTITTIDGYAFRGCKKIAEITIPSSVISLGENVFEGCSLLNEAQIDAPITAIPTRLFLNCTSLTTVTLPKEVQTIGVCAFEGCTSLQSLPLPKADGVGLKTIEVDAFASCSGIKMLEIPATVEYIKKGAFSNCTNLIDLTIAERGVSGLAIGEKAFSPVKKDVTTTSDKSLNIYSYVTTAPTADANAFWGYENVQLFNSAEGTTGYEKEPWSNFNPTSFSEKSITYYKDNDIYAGPLREQVGKPTPKVDNPTRTGWVFGGWREVIPALMPNEDLEIHGYFTKEYPADGVKYQLISDTKEAKVIGFDSPTSVVIPKIIPLENNDYKVVSIEARAFEGANTLLSVDFSHATNLTSIGNAAFAGCTALESVTSWPTAITAIADSMFCDCNKLSTFEIPESVTSLGDFAFKNTGLTEVSLSKNITTMGKSVFRWCRELKKVVFNKEMTLTTLPEHSFYGCNQLESFTLPTSMTEIGANAFRDCSNLKVLVLEENIATINSDAFNNCGNLKAITLPGTITHLLSNAFLNCKKVEMLTINSDNAPYLGSTPFSTDIYTKATLCVKDVSKYNNKDVWKEFANIQTIGTSYKLIYQLDGKDYKVISNLSTGAPVTPEDAPDKENNPKGRAFSGWKGVPDVMPHKDSVIVGSLKYQLTYVPEGTKDVLNSDSLFYGDKVSHPENSLKKDGLNYVILKKDGSEYVISNMPAKDDTLYVRYSLKQAPTASQNLKYNAQDQNLISKGSSTVGTLKYSFKKEGSYAVDFPAGKDAKTYRVYYRVEGVTTNYNTVPDSIDIVIAPREITSFSLSQSSYIYDGSAKKPEVIVKYGDITVPSSEYTVSYLDSINAGTATVTVADKADGNYNVHGSKTFTINKADGSLKQKPVAVANLIYSGTAQKLITAGSSETGTVQYRLSKDEDYQTTIPTGTNAGEYTVYYQVKGDANHKDTNESSLKVTIDEKPIEIPAEGIVLIDDFDYTFDGNEKKPVVVSVKSGDLSFTEADYTVSYSNNKNVGTEAKVILTDKKGGNYNISGSKTFSILPAKGKLTELLKQSPKSISTIIYNGKAQNLIIAGSTNSGTLKYSFKENGPFETTIPQKTDAGTYKVFYRVENASNYGTSDVGSLETTIAPREITSFSLSQSSYTYDGSEKKPEVTVKYGEITVSKEDYTVSYTNNKNAGTATVTVTDKAGGNYNVHGSKTFTINKADGSLKQKPVAVANLIYSGTAQKLITAGSSETGTIEYSSDKVNFGTTIPVGTYPKTYTVHYRVKGDANHKDVNTSSFNVTIAKAPLTISVGDYEIYEGEALPEFSISYSGFVNNETESVLITKPTVSCKATASSKAGDYTISLSGSKAENYNITHQNGKLVILAKKFVSGGESVKDDDDAATYQVTSTQNNSETGTPTVAIIDDKEVSGKFTIPETVTNHNKTYTVTEIGESTFENNKNLTEVIIPRSVTGIGDNAFKGCVNLKAIMVYNPTPVNLSVAGTRGEGTRSGGSSVFEGVDKFLCILYVPDGSVDLYKAAPVWKEFKHIIPMSTTGINGVTISETEVFDVYDLRGRKVKSRTTNLDGLTRGIYIINGKKVVVK